jgi:histidine ammonia-lyase
MATFAARRLLPMVRNVAHIIGIEWLAAAQGVEFLRPLRSSAPLEAAHALLRECSPPVVVDRLLAPDINHATSRVVDGTLAQIVRSQPGLPTLLASVYAHDFHAHDSGRPS